MQHAEFSYENLMSQSFRREGRFESVPMNNSFVAVCNNQASGEGTGWKFHISVAGADVAKAWNLLADYLINQNIGEMKVATPGCAARFDDPMYRQAGKMITVYDFGMGQDWQKVMQGVETLLETHGIRPGHPVQGDREVSGSRYMYYRNDRTTDGRYMSSREIAQYPAERQYNVSGRTDDPFAKVHVAPARPGRGVSAFMEPDLEKTVPRMPKVTLPEEVPEAKYWKPQRDQFDNPLMSLPIEGAPMDEVAKVKAVLKRHGFSPEERQSKSMGGQVLYVSGEDASRLRQQLTQGVGGRPAPAAPPRYAPPVPPPPGQPSRGR